jgi:REP element-mobilizing transposase RayT
MPNHLHLLLSPGTSKKNVSDFIGGFKSKSTRLEWKNETTKLWQGRFYDHILRRDENLREVVIYILNNPVRKKLVTNWEEYEFCRFLDEIPW